MEHHLATVVILTIGFTLASFFAYVMQRLKLPSILGYLLAGYIIGPYSPGFVADLTIAEQLAEIGVILMLFGVGLHFKVEDLLRVKNIAIPGAIGQTFVSTLLACVIVYWSGWSIEAGLIIGLSVGVASTVVLVRLLTDNHLLNTLQGHIAVGWLVVEDIFTVIILILLPTFVLFSSGADLSSIKIVESIAFVILKFLVLVVVMFTWGHKIIAYILTNIARLRSQELFTLTVLAVVFLIATGSSVVFGTSIALGAFIAGMVIGKTTVRHQAAANALPLKDIFTIIFFLSVGMLFNPMAIVKDFWLFAGIMFVILIAKPVIAYLITGFLGYSVKVALTVGISLAQIGEFSFILAEQAMNLQLIPDDGFDILVACAFVSISLNPLFFQMLGFLESKLQKKPFFKVLKKHPPNLISEKKKFLPKVIIIGYGPIGKESAMILKELGYSLSIIEQNIDTVKKLEQQNVIIFGDAADSDILKNAQIEEASHLIITIPETEKTIEIVHAARRANPAIQIVARIQYISDNALIKDLKIKYVCEEEEVLKSFTSLIRNIFIGNFFVQK